MYCSVCSCLDVGLDGGLEGLGVCADNLGDLVTTLEQEECGHCADAELLSDIRDLVDVELVEACLVVCVGEPGTALDAQPLSGERDGDLLDNLGSNHFTRAAPCRKAVKDHEGLLVVHRLVECRLAAIQFALAALMQCDVASVLGETTDIILTSGGCVRPAFHPFWRC